MQSCDYGRRFSELSALQQHQIAKIHCYCRECDRFFVHTDAVEQHRLSTVHNPPARSNASVVNGARSNLLLLRRGFTTLKVEHVPRK